jgi:hypothetical protein
LKRLLIAGLLLGIGIGAYFHFFPNEEKRVRKQFQLLSEQVAREPGEDLLSTTQRVKHIGRSFTDPCEFKIEGDPLYALSGKVTREEVMGYALRGRSYFSNLSMKFYDLKVEFPERGKASVRLTARLTGRSVSGENVEETRELLCGLSNVENRWLVQTLEVVEILKR